MFSPTITTISPWRLHSNKKGLPLTLATIDLLKNWNLFWAQISSEYLLSCISSLWKTNLFLKVLMLKCDMISLFLFFFYKGLLDPRFQSNHHKQSHKIHYLIHYIWNTSLIHNYLRYWKTHHGHYKNFLWVKNHSYKCHYKIFVL